MVVVGIMNEINYQMIKECTNCWSLQTKVDQRDMERDRESWRGSRMRRRCTSGDRQSAGSPHRTASAKNLSFINILLQFLSVTRSQFCPTPCSIPHPLPLRDPNYWSFILSPPLPVHSRATMVAPTASLTPLSRADGSASYQCPATGANILGSVNAPVELPGRRDALKPEEATVEVFVKPGTAPGGVGERYVEGIIKTMLGRVILGREKGYARRGVVLTLAIVGGDSVGRGDSVSGFRPLLDVRS